MAFNEQIHASARPNIFELLAQESMDASLRPAIQHVCKVGNMQGAVQHCLCCVQREEFIRESTKNYG